MVPKYVKERISAYNYIINKNIDIFFVVLGIKDYSNWPTIPQVFINGEFVGGCDIMLQMHQSGELVEELKKVGIKSALLTAEEAKKEESK